MKQKRKHWQFLTNKIKIYANLKISSEAFFPYIDFRWVLCLWRLWQWCIHCCGRLQDWQRNWRSNPVPVWILCCKFYSYHVQEYSSPMFTVAVLWTNYFWNLINSLMRIASRVLTFLHTTIHRWVFGMCINRSLKEMFTSFVLYKTLMPGYFVWMRSFTSTAHAIIAKIFNPLNCFYWHHSLI